MSTMRSGSVLVIIAHTRMSNLRPPYLAGFITYSCSVHVPSGTCS